MVLLVLVIFKIITFHHLSLYISEPQLLRPTVSIRVLQRNRINRVCVCMCMYVCLCVHMKGEIEKSVIRNWLTQWYRLTVPKICNMSQVRDPGEQWSSSRFTHKACDQEPVASSSPKDSRLETQEEPMFQIQSKGRRNPKAQLTGS